ncbi:MAG: tetratricopeptide repeat protein [Candidatus Sumerlaeota bacterium]|nr:tetratricopeptide repeat protein [Candidatus Sumerlaeota bacterium]
MRTNQPIERESLLETALFAHGQGVSPSGADPAIPALSPADEEVLVAFVERRMDKAQTKSFRKRLINEPALQTALADFVRVVRGTDYSRQWLNEPGAQPESQGAKPAVSAVIAASAAKPGFLALFMQPRWVIAMSGAAAVIVFGVAALTIGPKILRQGKSGAQIYLATLDQRLRSFENAADGGDYATARRGLKQLLEEHGVPAPTREAARKSLEITAQNEWRALMDRNQYEQAAKVAEEALSVVPDQPLLWAQAGEARLMNLRTRALTPDATTQAPIKFARPGAISLLQPDEIAENNGLKKKPEDKAVKQETDRILNYYARATKLDPNNVRALVGQGEIYLDRGEITAANQVLGRAKTVAPDDVRVQNTLALLFVKKGREDLAREVYSKALQAEPGNQAARYNLNMLFNEESSGAGSPKGRSSSDGHGAPTAAGATARSISSDSSTRPTASTPDATESDLLFAPAPKGQPIISPTPANPLPLGK